jgi:hypothetical protein
MKAIAITILITLSMGAYSQDNWIRCKHTATGAIQSFPGMSCPTSWYPV